MTFADFCRAHGLIVDRIDEGRWIRTPTTDHPRTKNGAYKCLGDVGWVQNHATMVDVDCWRSDRPMEQRDVARVAKEAGDFDRKMREGWARAARRAQDLLSSAKTETHGYLMLKGFEELAGLVLPDEVLLVPMRHLSTNALVGAQLIRWLPEERKWEKKMLPGMRAKGAVLRLGARNSQRTWLVEGYATGLSLSVALRMLKVQDAVLVCFSDGNLVHVSRQITGPAAVFADNDKSGAGERAALATGLPYCMSPVLGEDANDMHRRAGVFHLAALTRRAAVAPVEVAA